jgi:virginiamycin B lyase
LTAQTIGTSIGILTVVILLGDVQQSIYAQQPEITIKEWGVPTANSAPHDIVADNRTGNVWFTEINANTIGRFDPKTEQFKEYDIPTPSSGPHGLVIDKDKSNIIWFTEMSGSKIGKLESETGKVVEFPTPTPNSGPHTPIMGKGVVWFTEIRASKIGRLNLTSGVIEEFPTPTKSSSPYGIITDPEGNAWFAELTGHKIGKVNANTGEITEHPTPTDNSGTRRIAIDSEGKLWFTEYNAAKIGSFDPKTEQFQEYDTISPSSGPYAIWVDISDNIWFSMTNSFKVGKFDQSTGKLLEYDLPTPNTIIRFIYTDNEGNVWFANNNKNKIGKITAPNQDETSSGTRNAPDLPSKEILITEVELSSANATQWIEVYNPTDHEISLLATMHITGSDGHKLQILAGFSSLPSHQYQVIGLSEPKGNPEWSAIDNTIMIYQTDPDLVERGVISNVTLWDKTPALTDTFGNSTTWQLNGTEWVFEEATPMRAIPEFGTMALMFIIAAGFTGALTINRFKIPK